MLTKKPGPKILRNKEPIEQESKRPRTHEPAQPVLQGGLVDRFEVDVLDAELKPEKPPGFYVVRPKDTLYSIAKAHGLTVDELKRLNKDVTLNPLSVGTKLRVSAQASKKTPKTSSQSVEKKSVSRSDQYWKAYAEKIRLREEIRKYGLAHPGEKLPKSLWEPYQQNDQASIQLFQVPEDRFLKLYWQLENRGTPIPVLGDPLSVIKESHFKKGADAKVIEAWKLSGNIGAGTVVAICDTGFDVDNPDFAGRVVRTFNAALRDSTASPEVRFSSGRTELASHGTSVASVAVGSPFDNQGGIGAAPHARMAFIKMDVLSDEAIANALWSAQDSKSDVMNISLGYPKAMPLSTYISKQVHEATTKGRNGLGMVITAAAGNANPASGNQTREISDFAAHPDVIAVGASNSLDQRSSYSFYGNISVVAPTNGDAGVGITAAAIDDADPSPEAVKMVRGMTSGFGGTSSAAPLVAGICSLMLSENPLLTSKQVKRILELTADKIGDPKNYNAQGHSRYYGYGRVNAAKAVALSRLVFEQTYRPRDGAPLLQQSERFGQVQPLVKEIVKLGNAN